VRERGGTRLIHPPALRPDERRNLLVAVVTAAGVAFVALAGVFALTSGAESTTHDTRLGDAVQLFGGPLVLPALTLAAIAALALLRREREAIYLAVAAVAGAVVLYLSRGVLQMLGADRDGGRLSDYPSGHEGGVVLFAGALAVLAWPRLTVTAARAGMVLLVLALALAVAWARVESGAHSLVDVAGGFVFAVGWLALSVVLVEPHADR
jgi:membrane-associated phospholipid phosphatase